jgi:hypothetical protein
VPPHTQVGATRESTERTFACELHSDANAAASAVAAAVGSSLSGGGGGGTPTVRRRRRGGRERWGRGE